MHNWIRDLKETFDGNISVAKRKKYGFEQKKVAVDCMCKMEHNDDNNAVC